ncbi:MAG: RNA 2',3'-cyclic phosphodiesterase, partial [Alphaproteobacteria bacterium]
MPRLFTGLEIPAPAAERLAALRGGLAGARWVEPENYHVTLRFLGDVDNAIAARFAEALAALQFPAFALHLEGLGSFGGRRPRALWAGVAASEPLLALQRAHEQAARAAGLEPEGRNFHPHVTLARLRSAKPPAVARWLEEKGGLAPMPIPVSRFVLYSSRASRGGGPY